MSLSAKFERRLLINYRLDPDTASSLVPKGLRPQLVDGYAVAGICLIRLGALRPDWVHADVGWRGEAAAHRVAVEWDDDEGTHDGVYIRERCSASWLPVAAGGRVFPGVHKHARFTVRESGDRFTVDMVSATATTHADVETTDEWSSSLFPTIDDASRFFRKGEIGWSPARAENKLEGLRLQPTKWHVRAGTALSIRSSYFDSLPAGSAHLDNILIMQDIPVRWRAVDGQHMQRRAIAEATA